MRLLCGVAMWCCVALLCGVVVWRCCVALLCGVVVWRCYVKLLCSGCQVVVDKWQTMFYNDVG